MEEKKNVRRRPGGEPEPRGLDELLAQVAREQDIKDLPGFGKPIDLESYFKGGEEKRVSNQLLKDNNILPQHLQYRKDAENLRIEAERLLQRESEDLRQAVAAIEPIAQEFASSFPSLDSTIEFLSWRGWPFRHASGDRSSNPQTAVAVSIRFKEMVDRYNRKLNYLIDNYTNLLERANEAESNYRNQVAITGRLFNDPGSVKNRDHKSLIAAVQSEFPQYPAPPSDMENRIGRLHRPRFAIWCRWFLNRR
jgi:hypothetical protein